MAIIVAGLSVVAIAVALWRHNIARSQSVARALCQAEDFGMAAGARIRRAGRQPRLIHGLRPVLAAALAACAPAEPATAPAAPASMITPGASIADQICRAYAQAQKAISANLMYDQCMYARGHRVPGFSPSPDSPGYQGELPGPALHNGGF